MKLSKSFTKTFKEVSKDETALNAQLLIKAGYINKEMAGVYDFLPLGVRVLENIKNVVREELNAIGCEEMQLTALQNPESWEKTGRWNSEKMDIWFKTELSAGGLLGLAPTHEEPLTNLMTRYISSYKDLPAYIYQFQTKFRNELRAKSGILRTREFLMKDLYSFSLNEEEHNKFYHEVEQAYARIYDRLGLGDCTYECFASGGAFSKYSHEYQTITPVGEDTVYHNKDYSVVLNEEVFNDEVLADLGVTREEMEPTRAAEVGNIFTLRYKFSEPMGLEYNDDKGDKQTVFMGSYGIGISRVMGVIVEKYADEKGIVWPENIAPYKYYVIGIGEKGEKEAEKLYEKLGADNCILDDRDARPGQKFADAELMGIPYRVVISDKTLENEGAEITTRATGDVKNVSLSDIIE
ncbi:MAG: His/Gly/Thr/Pro-type tRNA ligase C-terminal domain-containing protein [Candidatus Saccharibacteria bacterium]|nr:His/Gly/Thr/Pro-type tRNA ligase C-terminal domain-containing protein [Candidatus Saccharibacteria bacterium]